MDRNFALAGALIAFAGVCLGAFGAHALKSQLSPAALAAFETGVRYQLYHALALFAVAWSHSRWGGKLISAAGWLMVSGVLLFCGSLYLLTLTGMRWPGPLTPLGGLTLLAGWSCLACGIWRARS